jgi:hypothetical protein
VVLFTQEIVMRKVAALLGVLALAGLSACSTYDPNATPNPPNPDPGAAATTRAPDTSTPPAAVSSTPPAVVASGPTVPFRPGYGRVEAVTTVPVAPQRATAGAGGTVGYVYGPAGYQLTLRMDDGSAQTIIQDNAGFRVGDRIQLTGDGRVIRL